MRRGYKVNVVVSSLLKFNHDAREIIIRAGTSISINTDIVVLAEYASKIAVGKKIVPDP